MSAGLRIAGAGLAGLLAAHAWPMARVFEPQSGPRPEHRALLRFRTQDVANLVGVEFHPVTVRKAIWYDGGFCAANIKLANLYSRKILGRIVGDRSIWNLDPVQRFIAPEDLYDQLVEHVGARVAWGIPCDYADRTTPIISTAPLPIVVQELRLETGLKYPRAAIRVERWRVPNCSAYQTVYFPDDAISIYRASVTGDLLIIESTATVQLDADELADERSQVFRVFGFYEQPQLLEAVQQKFGKIVPLPDGERRALLYRLTSEFGVFSLGRFATWRNVLLDDVVQDIAVVRRLLRSSKYEQKLLQNEM